MSASLHDDLMALARQHEMLGKGFLGLALVITERAGSDGLPLDVDSLMTKGGGQVKGAGGGTVRRILAEHGIERRLSAEGGRTSRGTPAKARELVKFLNEHLTGKPDLLPEVMSFWIARIRDFFASKPFTLHLDPALGVGETIRELVRQVQERQRETVGATLVGTVIQHLVGAKLEVRLGLTSGAIAKHGASVNDASQRGGDLEVGDTVIHVTTAPAPPLIQKCKDNASAGLRPVIVTGSDRTGYARTMADDNGLSGRVDIFDYEQFLASNVFEIGQFDAAGRRDAFEKIVGRYNEIVTLLETDPGLRIEIV
jgi:hypothetical protein